MWGLDMSFGGRGGGRGRGGLSGGRRGFRRGRRGRLLFGGSTGGGCGCEDGRRDGVGVLTLNMRGAIWRMYISSVWYLLF